MKKGKVALVAINVFFGVVMLAWPLAFMAVLFGGDNPPAGGSSRWLYEYAAWSCRAYPLVYIISLFVGIHEFKQGRSGRAILASSVPGLTASPWFALYLVVGLLIG